MGSSVEQVRKIFLKTNISCTQMSTCTCAYQGLRKLAFRKILHTQEMDDSNSEMQCSC